jgi:hypothetical protein
MDAASLRHLQFLETIYPDLNCLLRMNPSLNVLVKPKSIFNPFAKSVMQTLNFDAVLSFHITLDNHTSEVLLLIDENINYGILDRRGQPFEWKAECLQGGNLTFMEWSYYHINGNETTQICSAPHMRVGLDGNIATTLQTLNNYTYGKYSCN